MRRKHRRGAAVFVLLFTLILPAAAGAADRGLAGLAGDGFFARLWELLASPVQALWGAGGGITDPDGRTARTKGRGTMDPNGSPAPTDGGGGMDPDGQTESPPGDGGIGMDPDG